VREYRTPGSARGLVGNGESYLNGKKMEFCTIEKISILDDGRIAVFPKIKKGMWQYVYREAAGVHWENESGYFTSTPPREWTAQDWYKQIIAVVRTGVGLEMKLSDETEYEPSEASFKESIKVTDIEVRNLIKKTEQGGAGQRR